MLIPAAYLPAANMRAGVHCLFSLGKYGCVELATGRPREWVDFFMRGRGDLRHGLDSSSVLAVSVFTVAAQVSHQQTNGLKRVCRKRKLALKVLKRTCTLIHSNMACEPQANRLNLVNSFALIRDLAAACCLALASRAKSQAHGAELIKRTSTADSCEVLPPVEAKPKAKAKTTDQQFFATIDFAGS